MTSPATTTSRVHILPASAAPSPARRLAPSYNSYSSGVTDKLVGCAQNMEQCCARRRRHPDKRRPPLGPLPWPAATRSYLNGWA